MNLKQIIKKTAAVILLTAVILGVGTGPLAKAAGDSSFEVSLQTGYNGFLEIGIFPFFGNRKKQFQRL